MPWGDGTGPRGYGPMTGRAMGYCAGYRTPGYANPGVGWGGGWGGAGRGRGFGRGCYGRGRGFGWGVPSYGVVPPAAGYYPPTYPRPDLADDADYLVEEANYLKNEVKAINERLAEIDEAVKKIRKDGSSGDKDEK